MTRVPKTGDLRKEPLISKNWSFSKSVPSAYPDGILITGANSFIGTHVIRKLQHRWQGPVHLLVRAATSREAIGKMSQAFATWKLGVFHPENFTIHLGDVSLNMMGLGASEYSALKKSVGFVLHLAMNPLYHLPYAHFKRLWLPELERMITCCGDKSYPKSLHYPSSYNADLFTTDSDFKQLNNNAWQSGYAGFKWVAGKALENAFAQNLNGCLYDIPLVLGAVGNGLCPRQYTIWYILDMFLKTKCYIPFHFRIIPVDVLSDVVVNNLMADANGKGIRFIRPVLKESVSDEHFGNMAASLLGLQKTVQENMRKRSANKNRFDFVFPPDFYQLLDKLSNLPAVFPDNYNSNDLPPTAVVFLSNLNKILSASKNFKQLNHKT
ncbi:MAG: hypothetical protein GXO86_08695 [Chlorobi bacterium]|nr:hypothetical protein [Chlorobiota bacterium]